MQAYRIVDWRRRYEVTSKGHKAKEDTPMEEIRSGILQFVRLVVHGHSLSAGYRRMVKKASALGPMMELACFGLFIKLLEVAADQERKYRGWILDDRQRPINAAQMAELLDIHDSKIQELLGVLMCDEVRWVEVVEFPVALQTNNAEITNVNLEDLPAQPGIPGKSGTLVGAFPANRGRLFETVTEDGYGNTTASIEAEDKVPGSAGNSRQIREPAGRREDEVQPQARPQASASASAPVPDSGSDPASASEQLSDSASVPAPVSAPVSDSVSKPGAGPGAGPGAMGPGQFSEQQRFEIMQACKIKAMDFTQIIHPRNSSDTTTITDIFSQLQQRLLSGCPYPLLEMSIKTARECWRGDNPMAMFVAAMKKPPFNYVPKRLSVIPGMTNALGKNIKQL